MDASPPSPPGDCDAKFPTNIVPAGSGDTLVEGIGGVDAAREEGRCHDEAMGGRAGGIGRERRSGSRARGWVLELLPNGSIGELSARGG